MEDHLISRVDQLSDAADFPCDTKESGEKEPLIPSIECRICQEEDSIKNLEAPCACSGSLKFAHRKCVQRWCNEKRDIICEICHQPYKSGYFAPTPQSEDTVIDISGSWTIAGAPVVDLNDPRLLAMAAAEHRVQENDYEDNSTSAASFCRSAAIILMALLLLRHVLTYGYGDSDDNDYDDDPSAFLALFVLRAAGFLIPCYIMIWAISILQRCRHSQETEAVSAADVAFMIRSERYSTYAGPAMSPPPV